MAVGGWKPRNCLFQTLNFLCYVSDGATGDTSCGGQPSEGRGQCFLAGASAMEANIVFRGWSDPKPFA